MILDHKYFVKGKIDPVFIADEIAKHQSKTSIGSHSIFLGQVRSDTTDEGIVSKIIYTSYIEMAEKEISRIRETILTRYDLKCLHVYHSLGEINAGEISFFVFGSTAHRKDLFEAIKETVELVKDQVPIWKKEVINNK